MKFALDHSRDLTGNRIKIKIQRESDELVAKVETVLDRSRIGRDNLTTPAVHFEKEFRQAGSASPGQEHTLVVTVTDQNGQEQVAAKIWTDDS